MSRNRNRRMPKTSDTACCPCASSADARHACVALLSFDAVPLAELFRLRLSEAAPSVAAFLEGTVIYTLSQQWDELLGVYVLKMFPVPYCSSSVKLECTAEASADAQFRYVAVLLIVSAALQSYMEIGPMPYQWQAWRSNALGLVPKMIGMCLGWALGDACQEAFLSKDEDAERWRGGSRHIASCNTPACNMGNVGVATLATLATAVAMLVTQPIASGRLGCGAHVCQLAASNYARALVLLSVNALSVMVKIIWTYTFKSFLTWGVGKEQQDTVLYERALMLWAVSLTAIFAATTVVLRRWRKWLEQQRASDGERVLVDVYSLGAQYLSIMEGTFGWVVGCAFTDALVAYTPLGINTLKKPVVAIEDVLIAAGFTLFGVLWLVASGQQITGAKPRSDEGAPAHAPPAQSSGRIAPVAHRDRSSRREEVEAEFATNAFIFFVGWSWVVVLRDITALVWLGVTGLTGGLARGVAFFAEGCTVTLLGPVLTAGVLWLRMYANPFERIEQLLDQAPDSPRLAGFLL